MLRAFTTLKYNCNRTKLFIVCTVFLLLLHSQLFPQQSVDFLGTVQSAQNRYFRLNNLEGNTGNSVFGKDWEVSAMFSSSKQIKSKTSLYSLSVSKQINNHYLFARYTPGYSTEFLFNSAVQVVLSNPIKVETELQKSISYNEDLGIGYSYKFSNSMSAGFSLRYFTQNFSEEVPSPVITDSVNYLTITNKTNSSNFWRGDIGITYQPVEWLSLSASTINLIIAEENSGASEFEPFLIKKNKGVKIHAKAFVDNWLNISFVAESPGNLLTGVNYTIPSVGSFWGFGITAFHDKHQNPFVAGLMPAINYSTKLFSITFGGIKYLQKRNKNRTLGELTSTGIYSITNNQFSVDQLLLGINLALTFTREKSASLEDLSIETEIYPALSDLYATKPIAVAKVNNLSDKTINIRPSSLIPGLNKEKIYSPTVTILPRSTNQVSFYTLFESSKVEIQRREIKQAEFFIEYEGEVEDELKTPILINDPNAWDGDVGSLKYFVLRDLNYSSAFSKAILSLSDVQLKNTPLELRTFEKIKNLFDNIMTKMLYVADRRASTEIVQYPSETINLKGGDCDDLSVCFASILESIGVETAFVDYRNDDALYHVNLLVNTNLVPEQISLITNNDKKVVVRKNNQAKDYLWIPIETTVFKDFKSAWATAAQKFETEAIEQLGLAKGKIHIIDIN